MTCTDELRNIYKTLGRDQRLTLLDGLAELLHEYKEAKTKEFDSAKTSEQRIALLSGSLELQQLIHSVRNEKSVTRKNTKNDAQILWQSIEKFFENA